MMNKFKTVKISPRCEKRVEKGHLWIFSNEVEAIDKTMEAGSICRIVNIEDKFVDYAFFNPHSLIIARLLKYAEKEFNEEEYISQKLKAAVKYRSSIGIKKSGRMFFGESDGIPGLIVDKYMDCQTASSQAENPTYLIVEMFSAGADKMTDAIIKNLVEIFKPEGIFLKNTNLFRTLECLALYSEVAYGKVPETAAIEENSLLYEINLKSGQKTGCFFDQRENRKFLIPFFKNKKVMDICCYNGSFSLLAAASGAKMVWGIDSSEKAIEAAKNNAKINNLEENVVFRKEEYQKALSALEKGMLPEQPDLILFDPPNFVKNRKHLPQAQKLYTKMNASAIKALPHGGLLATSSCSHHISKEIFCDILKDAAGKARRKVFILELRGQAKDHPIMLNMPETEYLHFALLRVE
ncbi:MAG: class I SAM-dependent rRNA methyltransferase [Elusimicrobia bacterium]|nr:class I SAM-dependent rRNA methyltransferase [Elusimicrobiota bacterium]